jgi:Zn-dependent M28 family amino/carboxypeptidase
MTRPACLGSALATLLALGACKKIDPPESEAAPKTAATATAFDAASVLTPDLLLEHTRVLSDDAMAGRAPGTEGGERAVAYIIEQMRSIGLAPAGEDGEYTQRVAMRSVALDPERSTLALAHGTQKSRVLALGEDIVAGSLGDAGTHHVDAPIVFAGYGITAPEYEWDDYDGLDVEGKIVLVLVGDPPLDDGRFGGDALTYYGRWSYKFERALEAGAHGCLVIHETEAASYGWNVVRNSWSGERFHVVGPSGEIPPALGVQGWVSKDTAQRLAKDAGSSLATWHESALRPDFEPVDTGTRLRGELVTTERRISDVNVLGKIEGARWPDEAVFITAHWDHLGTKPDADDGEDAIFNGAIDNASGIAGMLGVATAVEARRRAGNPPGRSIVFLATTAEEQGLLGSKYYAANPLIPLERIVGLVNLDSMNVHGRTRSIQIVGPGQSSLETLLAEVAREQGRTIVPDERPGAGGYYRSDHFSFAKRGVPAIYFRGSNDMEDGGMAAGEKLAAERAERYHTVADELDPTWSFEGTQQDALAVLELVLRVADAEDPPSWLSTSEFARLRPPPEVSTQNIR